MTALFRAFKNLFAPTQEVSFVQSNELPPSAGVLALAAPNDKMLPPTVELYPHAAVGGKGANLLVIRRCGASVPAFLILPVSECERALTRAEEKTGKSVKTFLATGQGGAELREAMLADALSEDVSAMVRSFVGSGGFAFAVRSSANVEDGSDSAFAGQFRTLLNVRSVDSVCAAVKQCWASLLGDEVRGFYVKHNTTNPLMAVVVMQQVDSQVAGVYFEANPVTGATSTHVVSAAPGQGEGIVSGRVPTDEFWLSGKDGSVKRRIVADNKTSRVGLAEVADGTRDEPVPAELQAAPSLSDDQLRRLFEAVKRLRKAFKSPQDVEWCFDKHDRLFVLQSRPITTRCEALSWDAPDVGLWRLNAHVSKPMSAIYSPIWRQGWSEGCMYNAKMTGTGCTAVDACAINGFGYFCMRFPGPKKPPTAPPPKLLMRTILRLTGGKDTKAARAFWEGKSYLAFRDEFDNTLKPGWIAKHRALQAEVLAGMNNAQLADYLARCHDHMEAAWLAHVTYTLQQMQPAAYFVLKARQWTQCTALEATACLEGCSKVSEGLHGEFPAEVKTLSESAVARAILTRPSSKAAETQAALLVLSPEAGGDAARRIVTDIECRLAEGYDPANMIVKESPELVVNALRVAIDHAAPRGPDDKAAAALRARVPEAQRAEFDQMLQEIRSVMHLRDERALYTDLWAAGILHRAMVACGERLGQPKLVVEGTFEEIRDAVVAGSVDAKTVAAWAQRSQDRASRSIRDAPELIGGVDVEMTPEHFPNEWLARSFETVMIATRSISTPQDYEAQYEALAGGFKAAKKILFGLAGSAGVVEGTARVLRDASDVARVQKGDVVVTESPSSLINMILPLASAIVCDFGATLSHAAVCAREAGIPCVIGARNGTVLIKDGDKVKVDGNKGVVEVL